MAAITRDGSPPRAAIPFLLRLYPVRWRARYGDEFVELLETRPPSLRDRLDIVVGAVDARVNPQVPGAAEREIRVPGDRTIRALAVATGALLTVWGVVGAAYAQPWNSGGMSPEPALSSIAYMSGMAGAFAGMIALVLIALRYDRAIGSTGIVGALLAGAGIFLAALGAGPLALVLLGVGTGLLAWRLRGRMLDTPTTLVFTGATLAIIAAFFAFAAGGGQDVRILRALVSYGPAWLLFGLRLRAPMVVPAIAAA